MQNQIEWKSDNFYFSYNLMIVFYILCVVFFVIAERKNVDSNNQKIFRIITSALAYAPMATFLVIIFMEYISTYNFDIIYFLRAVFAAILIIAPQFIFVLIAMVWIRPRRTSVQFVKMAFILGLHMFGIWWANQVEI